MQSFVLVSRPGVLAFDAAAILHWTLQMTPTATAAASSSASADAAHSSTVRDSDVSVAAAVDDVPASPDGDAALADEEDDAVSDARWLGGGPGPACTPAEGKTPPPSSSSEPDRRKIVLLNLS